MKCSLCIDLLYLEIGPTGPIFSDTEKLLAGMELAKKTGYGAVEFWDWFGRDWEKLLAKKKELGLSVAAICAKDRGNLDVPAEREKALAGLRETIPVAKQFDCPNIIVTAGDNAAQDRASAKQSIIDGLKAMAPIAEEAGVTLVLEPISGGYFVDSAEPFEIVRAVASPAVKVLFDIFHYQLMEGNITETIRNNLDLIGHLHAAQVPGRCEITEGELNYSFIIREIRRMGYDRYFGFEYMPRMEKEAGVTACRELFEKAL